MTQGVETTLDGEALVVRIPMHSQRRGGRKRIVAPDGREIAPTLKPQLNGTLVKALARAWRWQRILDEGVYATMSEIGEAEGVDKGCVSRIPSGHSGRQNRTRHDAPGARAIVVGRLGRAAACGA